MMEQYIIVAFFAMATATYIALLYAAYKYGFYLGKFEGNVDNVRDAASKGVSAVKQFVGR